PRVRVCPKGDRTLLTTRNEEPCPLFGQTLNGKKETMSRIGSPAPSLMDVLSGGKLASVLLDTSNSEELRRLKTQLHHQLVVAMDLSAIGTMDKDELREEVRRVAEELCQRSSSLLSRSERERLINEVLDETFGLGPLEPLMSDP